jgi:uncharacterized membrane protein
MSQAAWGMLAAGMVILVAGLLLARTRFRNAAGLEKVFVLAPVFEASALAGFGAEHFFFAQGLASAVPHWIPAHLFLAYFIGFALLAAAVSMIAWRCVRWSATLFALLMLIFVATIHFPNLLAHLHQRLFWTLVFRESSFAAGAMVLAGSLWPSAVLRVVGRVILGVTLIFFGAQHFLFPRFAPGVPLEKVTPAWVPAPEVLACFVGLVLLCAGVGLFVDRYIRLAAAGAGLVLLLVTFFFYGPIMFAEMRTPLAVEGVNYVFDTMLFASSVLLSGWSRAGE